jgi:hypothetical protein
MVGDVAGYGQQGAPLPTEWDGRAPLGGRLGGAPVAVFERAE